jgi:hypothetical protein
VRSFFENINLKKKKQQQQKINFFNIEIFIANNKIYNNIIYLFLKVSSNNLTGILFD